MVLIIANLEAMSVRVCARTHIYTHTDVCTYIYTHTRIDIHICVRASVYICVCERTKSNIKQTSRPITSYFIFYFQTKENFQLHMVYQVTRPKQIFYPVLINYNLSFLTDKSVFSCWVTKHSSLGPSHSLRCMPLSFSIFEPKSP